MKDNIITTVSTAEKTAEVQKPRRAKRRTCIWLAAAFAIAAIIAIVVPLAVILPRRKHTPTTPVGPAAESSIIVPLYIYPGNNAWDPLYSAISTYQNLTFVIVINPNSGPGSTALPDDTYIASIQRLNSYSNVRTIGYVRTSLATRDITSVLADVAIYEGWATNSAVTNGKKSLAVDGIFFDEAPTVYTDTTADYLTRINAAVKSSANIKGDKMTIHNPGTIPDSKLRVSQTDVQVIVENTYAGYEDQQTQTKLKSVSGDKAGFSYMVHSTPDRTNMQDLVDNISQHARYIFVTDLDVNYYESFGRTWTQFVAAMSR